MKKLFCLFLIIVTQLIFAQDNLTVVAVGDAELEKQKIIFVEDNKVSISARVREVLESDFGFYKSVFNVEANSSGKKLPLDEFEKLKTNGYSYVISLSYSGTSPM